MTSLAQRVRDYRYSKGWGPDELANRAEISRTALYQIESGKTELPRAGTLRRIAKALEVPMETLLGHAEGRSPMGFSQAANLGGSATPGRPRSASDWFPAEGAPLHVKGRSNPAYEAPEPARFGVEYAIPTAPGVDSTGFVRERELVLKLHEILATPLGEPVARILDETYRLLPQSRVVASYE